MLGPAMLTPLEPWIAAKIGQEGQPLSQEALWSYQLARINETLALIQTQSRFYQRVLGGGEIRLSAPADLAALPLTSADDIRAAPFDFLCVAPDEVERIVTLPTSGTTGPPKRVFFTAGDQELTKDFFHRGMSTLVGPGDCVLILLPGTLPGSVGELLKAGLERMGVRAIPHGPVTDPQSTLDLIERERVTALVGIPVQVFWLARLTLADPYARHLQLKSVLLSTDRVPEVVAGAINEAWACPVYNHYGTTEMGLGGGVDCGIKAGYHLREADLFFEIVDPATGRPVPDGQWGEVVFTTLTRRAMPLLRYRTGDMSRFLPGSCPCGSILRRMAHVHERLGADIALPGGMMLCQRDLDEALFAIEGLADFKVLFAQEETGTTLIVRVRPFETGPDLDRDKVLQALRALPALRVPLVQGHVSIEIQDWGDREAVTSGTVKRKITSVQESSR